MTNQEVFDFVYAKMLAQGIISTGDGGTCLYRGPNGLKCAAGHLIPDEEYFSEMEDYVANRGIVAELFQSKEIDPDFVRSLQLIHDGAPYTSFIPYWKRAMRDFAERSNLSAEVIKD